MQPLGRPEKRSEPRGKPLGAAQGEVGPPELPLGEICLLELKRQCRPSDCSAVVKIRTGNHPYRVEAPECIGPETLSFGVAELAGSFDR